MDWDLTLGGNFPTRFWAVFEGTLNNYLGVGVGPTLLGLLPFLFLVLALMFSNRVIEMIRRITSDQGSAGSSNSDHSEGFRNE